MNILKVIFLFLMFLNLAIADPFLDPTPETDPLIQSSVTFESYHVDPTTGDTSSSSPITVYVPLSTDSNSTNNKNYSFYQDNTLFDFDGTSTYTGAINFYVTPNLNGESSVYFYAAYYNTNNSEWEVLKQSSLASSSATSMNISFQEICTNVDANTLNCSEITHSASPSDDDEELKLFLFLTTTSNNYSVGTDITDTNFNGVYYDIKFSNKVDASNSANITDVSRGDTKLRIFYNGFDFSSDLLDTYISLTEASGCSFDAFEVDSAGAVLGSTLKSELTPLEDTSNTGSVELDNLNNGTCYQFRFLYCDKWGFCSNLSNQWQGVPEEIDALLKSQSCYLLTAGFSGEDKVIDYFRAFRDRVLAKSFFGMLFTQIYYETAPKVVPWILDRGIIKRLIRVGATGLYYLFKFWWAFIFFMGLTISIIFMGMKRYGRS